MLTKKVIELVCSIVENIVWHYFVIELTRRSK